LSIKVSRIDIFSADIPFKTSFKHASRKRESSESVFVRLEAKGGEAGFGESLPRPYVTGEDQKGVTARLKEILPALLLGKTFRSFEETVEFSGSLKELTGASKCAFELALLDCAAKAFDRSVSNALGEIKTERLRYSAAIGEDSICRTKMSALKFRLYGIKDVKLKVGDEGDIGRLKTARRFLGRRKDIRLDANCAWSAEEAIEKLAIMRGSGFSVIEQPTAKGDTESLKKVSDAIPEPVMADESMCTIEDARRLVDRKACGMFNIRISKCGGLLDSLEIARVASQSGIQYQLGCQVGETGILSAAGRHFASCVSGIKYLEGSYARFLLAEDIVEEDVSFGYGGLACPLKGPGLGVRVNEKLLDKYTQDKVTIK
jgi:muconate cycloisomerase